MPTYEYECKKCGQRFEEVQSIKAAPLKRCPREGCGGRVQRLIGGGGGLLFKGSGFYITDYRSDSYKKAAKAETGSESSSGSGSSASTTTSTPSKPTTKAD
ncbi:MAG: zinc ribbon domain-containing protein [Gemmatimonadota bacterium]